MCTCIRVVRGQSRKVAKPIFGRGLAVRCERSEHDKSQLLEKYLCFILAIFLVIFPIIHLLFLMLPLRCPKMTDNGMAAWRSGGIPALPFKSARPAAVAPNRSLYAGILSCFSSRFTFYDTYFSFITCSNNGGRPLGLIWSLPQKLITQLTKLSLIGTETKYTVNLLLPSILNNRALAPV